MVVIGDKNIRELVGKVISSKGDKTITVSVDRVSVHPLYKKRFTVTKKYYAHDEANSAQTGDMVRIRETRPMSKLKRWKLIEITNKTEQ